MDALTAVQRAALDGAGGQAGPTGQEEAAVLAAMLGFGPAPQGAAWKAGADGLGAAGLADYTAEDELAVDPAVRFSLLPDTHRQQRTRQRGSTDMFVLGPH